MSERMERQTGESSSSAVKVSKLVKRYGDMLALDYFDLDVHQGEIFRFAWTERFRQDHGD